MIGLLLLGSGGGMPMPNRFLSASLISYKGRKILVDCGEGTQVSMRMCNTGFKSIDIICITHIHGDHIIGLPGLLSTIGNSGRTESITIIGPEGITKAVNGLRAIIEYLPYEINMIENPKEKIVINNDYIKGEFEIYTHILDHSSPCLGYSFNLKRNAKFNVESAIKNNIPKLLWGRLQKGENEIVYEGKTYSREMVMGESRRGLKISLVTDSRPIPSIVDFIKESDLFICEGTYGDDLDIEKAIKNKHMTFREAGRLAKSAKVKKMLLTHFSTAMDEPELFKNNAIDEFPETIIGTDRMKLKLEFN